MTIQDNDNNYLGYKFIVSHDNRRGWLGQPHVMKSLIKKFVHLVQDIYDLQEHQLTWFCIYQDSKILSKDGF